MDVGNHAVIISKITQIGSIILDIIKNTNAIVGFKKIILTVAGANPAESERRKKVNTTTVKKIINILVVILLVAAFTFLNRNSFDNKYSIPISM